MSGRTARKDAHRHFDLSPKRDSSALNPGTRKERGSVSQGRLSSGGSGRKKKKFSYSVKGLFRERNGSPPFAPQKRSKRKKGPGEKSIEFAAHNRAHVLKV